MKNWPSYDLLLIVLKLRLEYFTTQRSGEPILWPRSDERKSEEDGRGANEWVCKGAVLLEEGAAGGQLTVIKSVIPANLYFHWSPSRAPTMGIAQRIM